MLPMERVTLFCPARTQASRVTMGQDPLPDPEALGSSQEKGSSGPSGGSGLPGSLPRSRPASSRHVAARVGGLLQNSVIAEGPLTAPSSCPFCLGSSVLKQSPSQPGLPPTQNITLRRLCTGLRSHPSTAGPSVCVGKSFCLSRRYAH